MIESISSKDRFNWCPYSAAQQPVQCKLHADVGSNNTAQGILQLYFSDWGIYNRVVVNPEKMC